jgi:F0F1-type ATP synthase membrane subunit a
MFFLWTLLFCLLAARRIYGLSHTRLSPGFWMNSLTTMLLLLGQSVQDSMTGKDALSAFALRMTLFIAVTLYACVAVYLIDRLRQHHQPLATDS